MFFLGPNDLVKIKALIASEVARRVNTTGRAGDQTVEHQEQQAPEHYIALSPRGGIPALTKGTASDPFGDPDRPGYAECQIFRVQREREIESDGNPAIWQTPLYIERVYNLSQSPIPEDVWVQIKRDKNGDWLAETATGLDSRIIIEETTRLPSVGTATIDTTKIYIYKDVPTPDTRGTDPVIIIEMYEEDNQQFVTETYYPGGTDEQFVTQTIVTPNLYEFVTNIYDLPYSGTGTQESTTSYNLKIYPNFVDVKIKFPQLPWFQTRYIPDVSNPEDPQFVIEHGVLDPDDQQFVTGVTEIHHIDPQFQVPASYEVLYEFVTGSGDSVTGAILYTPVGGIINGIGTNIEWAGTLEGGGSGGSLTWVLLGTVTHADLTDADGSQNVNVAYTLPAKGALHAILSRTKVVGSGGGVATLTHQPTVASTSITAPPQDGLTLNTVSQIAIVTNWNGPVVSWTATTAVGIQIDADINVANLTGGEWELYGLVALVP